MSDLNIRFSDSAPGDVSRPVLLFAHCLGGSQSIWHLQKNHCHAGGARVLTYDLPGHGNAPGPAAANLHMRDLAAAVVRGLDALGVAQVVFCGISLGGMIGQHLALLAPHRVRGLVLADTSPGFDATGRQAWQERIDSVRRDGLASLAAVMPERWFSPAWRAANATACAAVQAELAATDVTGYLACCAAIRDHDLRDHLHEIRVPTQVICGELDASTPLSMSQKLAAGIPGATLSVIAGGYHLPCVDFAPEFNAVLDNFLQRLPPNGV